MDDKLITIATYNYSRAEIIKGRLEAEGIMCYLKNVNLIQPDVSSGVKIRIKEKDVEKALKIILKIKQEVEYKLVEKETNKINKILLPIDFSDYSDNACLYALELAKKIRAEIKIFYSINILEFNAVPITAVYAVQPDINENLVKQKDKAENMLKSIVLNLKKKLKKDKIDYVNIDYSIVQGFAVDEIFNFADEYKPDIIIMGTKGESNNPDYILGSITSEIIEYAKVPVLAIPMKSEFNSHDTSHNIMYATDFDDADFVAINKLFSIVKPLNPKIYCTHVGSETNASWCEVQMQGLKEYFSKIYKDVNLECNIIQEEDFIKAFNKFIIDKKIEMVSIITHKRSIIAKLFNLNPSRTLQLLNQTKIPLLIFHS